MSAVFRLILIVFLVFIVAGTGVVAQNRNDEVSPFTEKQQEMLGLINKQKTKILRLSQALDKNHSELMTMSELLKTPRNVQIYRDSAQKAVNRYRKTNDKNLAQLQELYYEWIPFEREIMAVYTRYGELKAADKIDAGLRSFVVQHRDFILDLERLRKKIQDTYNECDFLLTTKLN